MFGIEARAVEDLPGERDRNFRLEEASGRWFVLKVLHPAEDPAVAEFQALALAHIAQADPSLPVPRVVPPLGGDSRVLARAPPYHAPEPPYHVRCVTWLAGRPLADLRSGPSLWRELGRFAARLDRALAEFSHPADDHELLWDLKRADRARALIHAPDLAAAVLDRFAESVKARLAGLRTQVIHNDFNAHNLLGSDTDPGRVTGLIDFGDMIRAPLSQELATAAAYQDSRAGQPLEAAAWLTAAYCSVNPLSDEEIAIIPDLVAARLALSAVISSWRAALHPDEAGYILRSQPTVLANLERLSELGDLDGFPELVARLAA